MMFPHSTCLNFILTLEFLYTSRASYSFPLAFFKSSRNCSLDFNLVLPMFHLIENEVIANLGC